MLFSLTTLITTAIASSSFITASISRHCCYGIFYCTWLLSLTTTKQAVCDYSADRTPPPTRWIPPPTRCIPPLTRCILPPTRCIPPPAAVSTPPPPRWLHSSYRWLHSSSCWLHSSSRWLHSSFSRWLHFSSFSSPGDWFKASTSHVEDIIYRSNSHRSAAYSVGIFSE